MLTLRYEEAIGTSQTDAKVVLTSSWSPRVAMAIRREELCTAIERLQVPPSAYKFSLVGLQLAYIDHSQDSEQHQPAHHATNTTPVGFGTFCSYAVISIRQCHCCWQQPRRHDTPACSTLLLPPASVRHIAAKQAETAHNFPSPFVSSRLIAPSASPAW